MHLQLYIRGVCPQVELWKSMMQNNFFKWRRTNIKTGKEQIILVQGGLRPSVLGTYEFIFPREALPEVLGILGCTEYSIKKIKLAFLRRIIGLKKIPKSVFQKAKECPTSVIINNSERGLSSIIVPGIWVHIIGIKEDKQIEMYDPQFKATFLQEAL